MKHSLDRKMDRILERENSGRIKKGNQEPRAQEAVCQPAVSAGIYHIYRDTCHVPGCAFVYTVQRHQGGPAQYIKPAHSSHIFGTDKIGRDIWARILYGGRIPSAWGWEAPLWPRSWGCRWGLWQVIRAAGLTGSS